MFCSILFILYQLITIKLEDTYEWCSSFYFRYTLRNAEYRLCLERNLDLCGENLEKETLDISRLDVQGMLLEGANIIKLSAKDELSSECETSIEDPPENIDIQSLGDISPEAQQYIHHLRSRLSSVKKVCKAL